MRFISDFDRLKPILSAALQTGLVDQAEQQTVSAFRATPAYSRLPETAREAEATGNIGLFLLRKTADVLEQLSEGNLSEALRHAQEARDLSLVGDPFDGEFYLLAARVAEKAGDDEAQLAFQERYSAYRRAFGEAKVLLGLAALHAPEVEDWFNEVFAEEEDSPPGLYVPQPNDAAAGFQPASRAGVTVSEDAVTLPVKILLDAKKLRFATFAGVMSLPEEAERVEVELELHPQDQAEAVLAGLELAFLNIRFIFEDNRYADLPAAEALAKGNSLLLELAIPEAWPAEAPLEHIWRDVRLAVITPGAGSV